MHDVISIAPSTPGGGALDSSGPPYDPEALDPFAGTQYWKLRAFGRRPEDYAARDYLTGSLLRDFRPQGYRRASWNPSTELSQLLPADLPDLKRQAAINLLHLDQANRQSLTRLVASNDAGGRLSDLVPHLWKCPPYGVLVTGAHGRPPSPRLVCKRAWLCPWCAARQAVDLYAKLRVGFSDRLSGKYLLLAIAQIARHAAGFRDDFALTATECRTVRRRATAALRARAKDLGVTAGLVTYTVGPSRISTPGRGTIFSYMHRVALLGEIELGHTEAFRRHTAIMLRAGSRPTLEMGSSHPTPLRFLRLPVPIADRRALRYLLLVLKQASAEAIRA